MKGKYSFTVSSRKLEYHFEIQRNIAVIKGNSGTGKTTLLNMLYEYSIRGRQSGFNVQTSAIRHDSSTVPKLIVPIIRIFNK